ncbi:hypothetical protein RF11_10717 [Thelohanellus kitauei]|uniref:Uncharacterized protein n=1 Tax=Thelohanellus kitauei TaxID=669202 RepID=A0A0C2N8P1_THEKT|nr:hypothetical protein RF11_10717 [Thelohanellus kitauei]
MYIGRDTLVMTLQIRLTLLSGRVTPFVHCLSILRVSISAFWQCLPARCELIDKFGVSDAQYQMARVHCFPLFVHVEFHFLRSSGTLLESLSDATKQKLKNEIEKDIRDNITLNNMALAISSGSVSFVMGFLISRKKHSTMW